MSIKQISSKRRRRNKNRRGRRTLRLETLDKRELLAAGIGDDIAIITTEAIRDGSMVLDDYADHKESRGFDVHIWDERHWGGGTGITGANNIRGFLQERWSIDNLDYVILIGNPVPDEPGAVPMLKTRPNDALGDPSNYRPTDYYYADLFSDEDPDLPSDWDADDDGVYGEWVEDMDSRLPLHEVQVGRIPCYGNYAELDSILQKIINYEKEVSTGWRESILTATAISAYENDNGDGGSGTYGYELAEAIRDDIAAPHGYTSFEMWEADGLSPPPGGGGDRPLTRDSFIDQWDNVDDYGFVNYWGHGSSSGVFRRVWERDFEGDGEGVPNVPSSRGEDGEIEHEISRPSFYSTSDCSELDNTHPSFVTMVACSNGRPENHSNLGYETLVHGGIGVVSATRTLDLGHGWDNSVWETWGDPASYAYKINERMIEDPMSETMAEALQWCRENFGGDRGDIRTWRSALGYNFYGDPTTTVGRVMPNLRGTSFIAGGEPDVWRPGDTINVHWDIENNGNGDASDFMVNFFVSKNVSISTSDYRVGYSWVGDLTAGATTGRTTTVTLPDADDSFWSDGEGTYYLGMLVDSGNEIAEISETDNSSLGEWIDYDEGFVYDDRYEDNDASDFAYDLSDDEGNWLSAIHGFARQGDDDWYQIEANCYLGDDVPENQRIVVDCTFANSEGNIDLELYDATRTTRLAVADSSTDNEHLETTVESAGTYFIRVHHGNAGNVYDLRWDDLYDDPYEENDSLATAYDLSGEERTWLRHLHGRGVQAFDQDWFRIEVTPGYRHVQVQCTFAHAEGDLEVSLYDDDGTPLTSATPTTDGESIDYVVPADGTYYILVDGPGANQAYDLWWDDLLYSEPPVISGLPDLNLNEDDHLDDVIDLHDYASDVETSDAGLTYSITRSTSPDCGVSIDGHFVDIEPTADWSGSCEVTIRVEDLDGDADEDTFLVKVQTVDDAPAFRSLVASPNPAVVGQLVTLKADGLVDIDAPGGPVTRADFYRESNGLLGLQADDTLVASDDCTDGSCIASVSTSGLAPGNYIYYAQTTDDLGATGPEGTVAWTEHEVLSEGWDFGDAPDPTYPTLEHSDGARHRISPDFYLGSRVDVDPDGQPDPLARGDDSDGIGFSDEDGVELPDVLVPGTTASFEVTLTAPGNRLLDAWIDFDGDGSWAESVDQIFSSRLIEPGINHLTFDVPLDAAWDTETYARFRVSSAGGLAFDGRADDGEVEDYQVQIGPLSGARRMEIGEVNRGIAAQDGATGHGFIMYSEESVHTRFASDAPYRNNSNNLIAVKYEDGQWHYDDNGGLHAFEPRSTDVLIAEVDFRGDTISSLEGVTGEEFGIAKGFSDGDLSFFADRWRGSFNDGEFTVEGTYFITHGSYGRHVSIGAVNNGIAAQDGATGRGFIMYSAESVHTRFASDAPYRNNSNNLIAVKYEDGQWYYDNNGGLHAFEPRSTDVLIAEVDFELDTITSLEGVARDAFGIAEGFAAGDLSFFADRWRGSFNDGEFTVEGTYFFTHRSYDGGSRVSIGAVNNGIAAQDAATGRGFIMYSEESVHTRFASDAPYPHNSNHLIAVKYEGGQWYYDNNDGLHAFTRRSTDVLLAEVDFGGDPGGAAITSLEGVTGDEFGIAKGFVSGDLTFEANRFDGVDNPGEFTVGRTYFIR